jgi:hypothetical protein
MAPSASVLKVHFMLPALVYDCFFRVNITQKPASIQYLGQVNMAISPQLGCLGRIQ